MSSETTKNNPWKAILLLAVGILLIPLFIWISIVKFGRIPSWVCLLIPLAIGIIILAKFMIDNIKDGSCTSLILSTPKALITYIPILVLAIPPLAATRCAESYLCEKIDYCNNAIADKMHQMKETRETRVREIEQRSNSVWYNPFTWGSKIDAVVERVKYETVTKTVIQEATLANKALWGGASSLLSTLVIIIRTIEITTLTVSFLMILSLTSIQRIHKPVVF